MLACKKMHDGRSVEIRKDLSCESHHETQYGDAIMKKNAPKNMASPVRQRLLNISKERNMDYQLLLRRYGLERFLYRLSQSEYKDTFVLKGALLFLVWDEKTSRPTRDADFSEKGDNSLSHLKNVFKEICEVKVDDDGVIFYSDTVESLLIKEDQEYEGVLPSYIAVKKILLDHARECVHFALDNLDQIYQS